MGYLQPGSVLPSPGCYIETAARRQTTPEKVTVFSYAQAAINCMASAEPGPGQMAAIRRHARMHIATPRRARPDITIENRWRPARKGVPGNEKADEWAKLAADEPDSHGVAMDAIRRPGQCPSPDP